TCAHRPSERLMTGDAEQPAVRHGIASVRSRAPATASSERGKIGAGSFGRPIVLGIDAGGTMTDTLLVDDQGNFVVGKAPTTPHDESIGLLESVEDALSYAGPYGLKDLFTPLEVCLYAGTTMLNTLLSRTGRRLGLVTTRGFEDMV